MRQRISLLLHCVISNHETGSHCCCIVSSYQIMRQRISFLLYFVIVWDYGTHSARHCWYTFSSCAIKKQRISLLPHCVIIWNNETEILIAAALCHHMKSWDRGSHCFCALCHIRSWDRGSHCCCTLCHHMRSQVTQDNTTAVSSLTYYLSICVISLYWPFDWLPYLILCVYEFCTVLLKGKLNLSNRHAVCLSRLISLKVLSSFSKISLNITSLECSPYYKV
jgi:hypothetical protein